jgi:protein TonB
MLSTRPPAGRQPHQPLVSGMTVSLALHTLVLLLLTVTIGRDITTAPAKGPTVTTRLVYGGAGSSGGQPNAARPASRAQFVGRGQMAVSAVRPASFSDVRSTPTEPVPEMQLIMAVPMVASGLREAVGSLSDIRPDGDGRGPGLGPGGTGGRGPGFDGPGAGFGDGEDRDFGGVPIPGGDVSSPYLIYEVKPNYTADAMHARIQGVVELDIIVLPDGSVGRVRLVKSLDATFGLDREAIKAVRQWRFRPGRQLGKAIPVRVGVEVSFTLR